MCYTEAFIEITKEDLGFTTNDIFNKVSLSNEIYSKLGDAKTIRTIDGIKILPFKLAVIIQYYTDRELSRLYCKEMIDSGYAKRKFNKEEYDNKAIKIRNYYNQIIYFYHDEFSKYRTDPPGPQL